MKIRLHPSGSEVESLAVLDNGFSHIIEDDQCYVVVNGFYENGQRTDRYQMTAWIFGEALEVLKTLPPLTPP